MQLLIVNFLTSRNFFISNSNATSFSLVDGYVLRPGIRWVRTCEENIKGKNCGVPFMLNRKGEEFQSGETKKVTFVGYSEATQLR